MYKIAIVTPTTSEILPPISLFVKDEKEAISVYETLSEAKASGKFVNAKDDYNHRIGIHGKEISYVILIDLANAQICQHEANLAVAKAGKALAQRVNEFPEEAQLLGIGQNQPEQQRPRPKIIQ